MPIQQSVLHHNILAIYAAAKSHMYMHANESVMHNFNARKFSSVKPKLRK